MEELGGSLDSIRLIDVLRFLGSLGKSGSLRISNDRWRCQISFVSGTILAAAFQTDRGLDAVAAAVLLFDSGRFSFWGGHPADERNIEEPTADLLTHLQQVADEHREAADALLSKAPPFVAVQTLASMPETTLDGPSLAALLAISQQQPLTDLVVSLGPMRTVRGTSRLLNLGLIAYPTDLPTVPEKDAERAKSERRRRKRRDRVLVVEDDPETANLFSEILDRAGYEVSTADSALGAAALVRKLQPSAVVLDVGLPYRPGTSLLGELKSNSETASVPVVIVSGMVETLTAERREHAVAVLSKPIQPEVLLETVGQACSVRSTQ